MAVLTDASEPLYLLSVDDYYRMFNAGILEPETKQVELLEGVLFAVSENEPHAHTVGILIRLLGRAMPHHLMFRSSAPLEVRPDSVPQPDLAIVAYSERPLPATPTTLDLAIEASETSLRRDLTRKARIYARAGVKEYWVVDVKRSLVFVHLEPRGDRYASVTEVAPPAELKATHVDIAPIPLAELFT